jgi:thioredoxin 1
MVMALTDQNFKSEVLESKLPVFVDFHATWCGPCQMAAPVIDQLAKEYEGKIKVAKLDVDQAPQTAQRFGVMSIPTVIVFKGGQEHKKTVGFPGKAGYEALIKEVLQK